MASPYLKRRTWYLRWKDEAGRWRDKACGARTKAEARQLQAQLECRAERVRLGVEVGLPEDGGGTLAELLRWWLDTTRSRSPRTRRTRARSASTSSGPKSRRCRSPR